MKPSRCPHQSHLNQLCGAQGGCRNPACKRTGRTSIGYRLYGARIPSAAKFIDIEYMVLFIENGNMNNHQNWLVQRFSCGCTCNRRAEQKSMCSIMVLLDMNRGWRPAPNTAPFKACPIHPDLYIFTPANHLNPGPQAGGGTSRCLLRWRSHRPLLPSPPKTALRCETRSHPPGRNVDSSMRFLFNHLVYPHVCLRVWEILGAK